MGTIALLFVVGLVGSALFDHFDLPSGAMTGAMLAVILFWLRFMVYGCVGVLVVNSTTPARWRQYATPGR